MSKASNNPHGLVVGQRLFKVQAAHRRDLPGHQGYAIVLKVGNKFATIIREDLYHRADVMTHCHEKIWLTNMTEKSDFSVQMKCYLSKEDYEAKKSLRDAWEKLSLRFRNQYNMPSCVTMESITEINRLLGYAEET